MAKRVSRKPSTKVQAKPGAEIKETVRLIVKDVAARIEEVRALQMAEGNFDCYARAGEGYCDQGECLFMDECLEVSRPALAVVPSRSKK
jgi:hypothetical protein